MGLPGVKVNVLDGNLNLSTGNAEQTLLVLGCCPAGTPNTLAAYGDLQTLQTALSGGTGIGGELTELAGYVIDVAGGPVMTMPLPPTTRGGVGSVTHVGTGTGTVAVTIAPHVSITITCTTAGTLGTAAFTFQLGSGPVSAPVPSAASWSSTGYIVPGTYCTVVFTAGSYIAGGSADIYTVSTLGAVAHPQGAGPAVPTFTASPIDYYPNVLITIGTAGALGTATFAYALDGTTTNTSASVVTPGGGAYAIPNTGLVLTFANTFVSGDTYSFQTAGPTPAGADLTAALTLLETTLLNQATYSMVAVIVSNASASAWATQAAALETAALSLFNSGIYVRFFAAGPTVGTVLPNAGSITVDSADTDSTVIGQRASMSAPHVVPCAGDWLMTSPITGLEFRRNAMWAACARAAAVTASQDIGAVEDGGIAGAVSLYRDENATQGFYNAGVTCLRSFPGQGGQAGFYITEGITGAASTSDYYPLTNARVIDRGCTIARSKALPLVNSKIPTTTRNGVAGVITEKKAQSIEARVNGALHTGMVDTDPADAVDASVVVNRTHVMTDGNLIMAVNVEPFEYGRTVTVNIGLKVSV